MPRFDGTTNSQPLGARSGTSARREPPIARQGSYLTDGITLYRVQSSVKDARGAHLIELEDCRTLELILYPARKVKSAPLRPVVPISLDRLAG